MPRSRLFLSLLVLLIATAACGGGGGTLAATEAAAPDANPNPTPPAPPAPPPANDLDADLLRLARQADVTPVATPPLPNADLVALGESLFFDPILSGNMDIACATCHLPTEATGDGLSVSIGTGGIGEGPTRVLGTGALIARNAPPLFLLGDHRALFLDSRVSVRRDGTLRTPEPALNGANPSAAAIAAQLRTALEAQAMFPVTARDEMRGEAGDNELADATTNLEVWQLLIERLVGRQGGTVGGIAAYRDLFARAYPQVQDFDDLNFGHAARAIAAYEVAAFRQSASPFDAYLRGNLAALTDIQKRGGIQFFGRADCHRCHNGPQLSDGQHHAIGVPQVGPGKDGPGEDTGRFGVTGDPADRYEFATPTLWNVSATGPWMHDGAYTTLEAAVRHYDDPEQSLRNYDASQLAPLVRNLVDRDPARQNARAQAISNILGNGLRINRNDVDEITAFLRALTDPQVFALDDLVPSSVPSGLPLRQSP